MKLMTKTKDPRPLNKMLDLVTDENKHNLDESPKRCDECRWWHPYRHDYCNNEQIMACTDSYMFRAPPDFYCKYWEKKEQE